VRALLGSRGTRRALALAALALTALATPAAASRAPSAGERAAIVRGALGQGYPLRCVHVRVATIVPGWAATGNVGMRPDAGRHIAFCRATGHVFDGTAFLRRTAPGRWRLVVSGSSVESCESVPLPVLRDLFRFARAMDCPGSAG